MRAGVARSAHRNQVLCAIMAGVAAKLFVVGLQVRHRARMIDIASHRDARLAVAGSHKASDLAASAKGRSASGS
jgi:hypothetical protein